LFAIDEESDSAPPLRSFSEQLQSASDAVDIYLAIPDYRDKACNISEAGPQGHTRYSVEAEDLVDEYSGRSTRPVLVARKNLRFLIGSESREGHTTLKVARVRKTPGGLFTLDSVFVPPTLDFRTSHYLKSIAGGVVQHLAAKSTALMLRPGAAVVDQLTSAEIPRFWLRYTVNSYLPMFRHLLECRGGHAELLFRAMLQLTGALATFSDRVNPAALPLYNHDDLGPCFTDLYATLQDLLETVIRSNVVSIPLRLVEPAKYSAALNSDEYLSRTRLYLAVGAEMSLPDLIRKAPKLIKLSSRRHVEYLVQSALPGLRLTHITHLPAAVGMKGDREFFVLDLQGDAWEAIRRDRDVTAYVPDDFPGAQVELLIVMPRNE
jgi:type VI secretion system protein ImpJ